MLLAGRSAASRVRARPIQSRDVNQYLLDVFVGVLIADLTYAY
jgi:hypothetical protein